MRCIRTTVHTAARYIIIYIHRGTIRTIYVRNNIPHSHTTARATRARPVSRIGHRIIIRSPLGFCIYECIGCWNFHKGRAKNIRLLWGGGVFTMVPWAKILSDLNLVLTLYYRHCALASIASGGRYHSRSSRRCGRHHSCSS